jgi:hypothetical protein
MLLGMFRFSAGAKLDCHTQIYPLRMLCRKFCGVHYLVRSLR